MLNEYQECSVTGTIYLHPMLRNGEEKNLFYGHPVNSRGSPKEYIFQLPLLCSTLFPVLSHLSYLNIHNISENEWIWLKMYILFYIFYTDVPN